MPEPFKVEWHDVIFESAPIWINEQKVLTGASADAAGRPYLRIEDLGLRPDFTATLGGEYVVESAAARLVADYNHDRIIDEADGINPGPFRFWINDDNDSGDVASGSSDIPGEGSGNASDSVVNGRCDLTDFFPLWLDVAPLLSMVEEHNFSLALNYEIGGIGFVYTDLTPAIAGGYLTNTFHASTALSESVNKLTGFDPGSIIDEEFMLDIQNNGLGILLIEGRYIGDHPLELNILDSQGQVFCTARLPLRMSSIRDMYRWINLRHITGGGESRSTNINEPLNNPDGVCINKQIVFVHGFNVNESGAFGSASEVFKRLYWSGSRAMYTAVTWEGDVVGGVLPAGVYYHLDALNAQCIASNYTLVVSELPGQLYIVAHSLGNMLASAAIKDNDLAPIKYFMIDAAVTMEAYNSSMQYPEEMCPPDWRDYTNRLWASEWHRLWEYNPDDGRNELTWKDRFGNISQAINYYSSGEDILQNNPTNPPDPESIMGLWQAGQHIWCFQEMIKGGPIPDILWGVDSHGGWGFNVDYSIGVFDPSNNMYITATTPPQAASLRDDMLRQYSYFKPFYNTVLYTTNGSDVARCSYVKAKILSEAIPATSRATGRNAVPLVFDNNIDMMTEYIDGGLWPSARESGRWLHGDYRDVAYIYNFLLYDDIVYKGGFK